MAMVSPGSVWRAAFAATCINEYARTGQFDLLILDLGLPLRDGLTVLHQLRPVARPVPSPVVDQAAGSDICVRNAEPAADAAACHPVPARRRGHDLARDRPAPGRGRRRPRAGHRGPDRRRARRHRRAGAAGLALAAPAQAAEVDLDARMHATAGYPNARGHAEFESDRDGREFDISIAGVRSLAGRQVTVRVHGNFVGKMTVGRYGRAHLERHAGVPRMSAGNAVRVRTSSGKLVTYGTLHRDTGD